MIDMDEDVLALLDAGRISVRGLIRFDFGSGTYGFIKASVPITISSVTYNPGGIIKVSDLPSGAGLSARQFDVTLAASPDDGLTPAVLQTIEQEDYRDRPVTISDAYFHPDTGAFIAAQPLRRGYVDVIEHTDGEDGYTITARCETRALDYTRINGRKRTTTDQARRAANDLFFEHSAKRGREEVLWGRARQAPAGSTPAKATTIAYGGIQETR